MACDLHTGGLGKDAGRVSLFYLLTPYALGEWVIVARTGRVCDTLWRGAMTRERQDYSRRMRAGRHAPGRVCVRERKRRQTACGECVNVIMRGGQHRDDRQSEMV